VPIGILQRYVLGQVMRTFLLAQIAITAIFVLFMVMVEATRQGLAPQDILRVVPYVVPGTLPYTVPVALLFAVSVVYGRMAGDNEVIAVKTAGLGVGVLLMPTVWLGLVISGGLTWASAELIPRSNLEFRKILFRDLEDMFYKKLKKDHEFNNPGWPFFVQVGGVEGRTMKDATFKHRLDKDHPDIYNATIVAREARIRFDAAALVARVELVDADTEGGEGSPFVLMIHDQQAFEYPLPKDKALQFETRIMEKTFRELGIEEAEYRGKVRDERRRAAMLAALRVAVGRLSTTENPVLGTKTEGVDWPGIREAARQLKFWQSKSYELETERQMRLSMAFGAFFFVVLGAPVGILFARRDFLSAFISCFMPIILVYYPLLLAGTNLGKQGVTGSWVVWAGNGVLGVLAGFFALPPVRKH